MAAKSSIAPTDQYILPLPCIARFANDRNHLRVHFLDGSVKWIAPDSPLFQTARNWPQKDENGWMRSLESNFSEIAEQVMEMQLELGRDDCDTVTRFFLLWRYRYRFSTYGVGSISPNLPPTNAPDMTGAEAKELIFETAEENHIRWSSYHFRKGNLIVPDCPPDVAYLPVSPKVALVAAWTDKPEPEALNELAKSSAKNYYFQHKKFIPHC